MKNIILAILAIALSCVCYSQESLNTRTAFMPNVADSNNFVVYMGASFVFPSTNTTEFQKSTLSGNYQQGRRIFEGEMEIMYFISNNYDSRLHPHVFFRAQAFPGQYQSSGFGGGISDRKTSSSVGIFTGKYYRRVFTEANFTSNRGKFFETYPLSGPYLQSSSEDASFFFFLAKEKRRYFRSVKVSSKLGHTLSLGDKASILRTLEASLISESFTGNGFGVSVSPTKVLRMEILWTKPDRDEQAEQALVNNKLIEGLVVRLEYSVN